MNRLRKVKSFILPQRRKDANMQICHIQLYKTLRRSDLAVKSSFRAHQNIDKDKSRKSQKQM